MAIGEPLRTTNTNVRIRELQRQEELVFYPKDEVNKILNSTLSVRDILDCRCPVCERHLRARTIEQDEILQATLNPKSPKVIILAILIYLGKSFVIKWLSRRNGLHDQSPRLDSTILSTKEWAELLSCEVEHKELDKRGLDERACFLDNYAFVVELFNPPTFRTEDWTFEYSESTRFPFLDDQWHRNGSFGEVRKFSIHKSYLDIHGNLEGKRWDPSSSRV